MIDNSTRTDLFSPTRLGGLELSNRIVMAPLTRSRATDDGVVGELQAVYYAQRASAGLIIAEATKVPPAAWTALVTFRQPSTCASVQMPGVSA